MLWLVLMVLLWGLLHSLLASLTVKGWARKVLGERLNRSYRLAYNIFAGSSFLLVLVLAFKLPDHNLYSLHFPWSALMIIGECLAVGVLIVGFYQKTPRKFLGLDQSSSLLEGPGRLTTDGLYRYVRHPLYSAGLVFIWLLPWMTINMLAINLALSVYVIIGATFEERKLLHEFGQQYSDYQAATPMFIPFLKGNKSHPPTSVL
jgi:protein-S-isoprenylcysteine O-methyltransferase Ste14